MQEILSIDTAGLLKACIDNKISFFDGIKSGYSINMYDLPLMLIQLLKQTFLSFKYPRFNTKKLTGDGFFPVCSDTLHESIASFIQYVIYS